MQTIKQYAIAAVILAGLVGFAMFEQGREQKAMAKEFQLTDAQAGVMKACKKSLSRHSRKFKEDINPLRGCACIAKKLTTGLKPARYQAAEDMVDLLIERSKQKKPAKLTDDIKSKPTLAKLPPAETLKLVMSANTSVGFCGTSANLARRAVASVKIPDFVPPKKDPAN